MSVSKCFPNFPKYISIFFKEIYRTCIHLFILLPVSVTLPEQIDSFFFFRLLLGLEPIFAPCMVSQRNAQSFSLSSLMLNGASSSANWGCVDENLFKFTTESISHVSSGLTFYMTWYWHLALLCSALLCSRYPSSQCSDSGQRWRVVWSLIWWKTNTSLQTLSSSTAGQLLASRCQILHFQYELCHFILGAHCSKVSTTLFPACTEVTLCSHMQHLWSRPWRCDQPVHYHLVAASRGWGRWSRPERRPGRDGASVSRRRTGASPASYPDVTQHQRAHRQSLCNHIKGLCVRAKLEQLIKAFFFFTIWWFLYASEFTNKFLLNKVILPR